MSGRASVTRCIPAWRDDSERPWEASASLAKDVTCLSKMCSRAALLLQCKAAAQDCRKESVSEGGLCPKKRVQWSAFYA
jgi:hypothetical protein